MLMRLPLTSQDFQTLSPSHKTTRYFTAVSTKLDGHTANIEAAKSDPSEHYFSPHLSTLRVLTRAGDGIDGDRIARKTAPIGIEVAGYIESARA